MNKEKISFLFIKHYYKLNTQILNKLILLFLKVKRRNDLLTFLFCRLIYTFIIISLYILFVLFIYLFIWSQKNHNIWRRHLVLNNSNPATTKSKQHLLFLCTICVYVCYCFSSCCCIWFFTLFDLNYYNNNCYYYYYSYYIYIQ